MTTPGRVPKAPEVAVDDVPGHDVARQQVFRPHAAQQRAACLAVGGDQRLALERQADGSHAGKVLELGQQLGRRLHHAVARR